MSWAKALMNAARGEFRDPGWAATWGATTAMLLHHVTARHARELGGGHRRDPGGIPRRCRSHRAQPVPRRLDLLDLGLALVGHPPFMLRPLATATAEPTTTSTSREARTTGELRDAERVLVEGYLMPDMAHLPPGDFYRPEVVHGQTRVFVGYEGDTPLATSAAHSAAGVTVVENVAVLGAARGKGAGAALTWAATRAWPDQPAVLLASDAGQPVYERLGYLRLVRWTCWPRPGTKTASS